VNQNDYSVGDHDDAAVAANTAAGITY